jgi:DUF1680 family protein
MLRLAVTLFAALLAQAGVVAPELTTVPPDATAFLPPDAVHLAGMLGRRYTTNEQQRLLKVDEDGILAGYRHRPGPHPWIGEHAGKFLHAAVLTWVNTGDAALKAKIDRVAQTLIASQEPDGYLGTYAADKHWAMTGDTGWDVWSHKYCLFGLLTYWQYCHEPAALECCRRAGDLLVKTFGPGPGQRSLNAAGTHQGLASGSVLQPMVMLYRATKDPKYLDWCRWMVEAWEQPDGPKLVSSLLGGRGVDRTADGKAYEMMSCLVGLVDLTRALRDTGDPGDADRASRYLQAARNAWRDIATKRLYIDGAASHGEVFHADGWFPNTGPLGETCANVTLEQFGLELFRLAPDAGVMDVMERTLYGHLLGAQNPANGDFCYYSGLEGKRPYNHNIDCCLSSGPRGVALLPTFAATRDADGGVRINLFSSGTINVAESGLKLTEATRWPYEGRVSLTVEAAPDHPLALRLRIPASAASAKLTAHGQSTQPAAGYAELKDVWRPGDHIELELGLALKVVIGETTNQGKLALTRGPVVLTLDAALLPADAQPLSAVTVAAEEAKDLPLTVTPAADDPTYSHGALFKLPGRMHRTGDDRPFDLTMVDFAHAGNTGQRYEVWMPRPSLPAAGGVSPFNAEKWSREGNVDGSISDGDPETFRVTYDGTKRDVDWFEVSSDQSAPVGKIVFVQGKLFHDGGWWDASGGKPRLEYRTAPDGPWQLAGALDSYPATTATDSAGLQQGRRFVLTLREPVRAVAVRVIGKPACGDSAGQSFASCADLLVIAP